MRKHLQDFANDIEIKLSKKDKKYGVEKYLKSTQDSLLHSIHSEYSELTYAIFVEDHQKILKHTTNIANYCMMVSTNSKIKLGI